MDSRRHIGRSGHSHCVHVIDAQMSTWELVCNHLRLAPYRLRYYPSGESFLAQLPQVQRAEDMLQCLLLNLPLPGLSGSELLAGMRERGVVVPAVVLSSNNDLQPIIRAFREGATGILPNPPAEEDLRAQLEAAFARNRFEAFHKRSREWSARLAMLTAREVEVMELLLRAMTIKEISGRIGIGVQTVAKHRSNLLKKLGLRNDVELALMAAALPELIDSPLRFLTGGEDFGAESPPHVCAPPCGAKNATA